MSKTKHQIMFADEAPNGHGAEQESCDDTREALAKDKASTAYALGEQDPDKAAQELLNILQDKPYGSPQPPIRTTDF